MGNFQWQWNWDDPRGWGLEDCTNGEVVGGKQPKEGREDDLEWMNSFCHGESSRILIKF